MEEQYRKVHIDFYLRPHWIDLEGTTDGYMLSIVGAPWGEHSPRFFRTKARAMLWVEKLMDRIEHHKGVINVTRGTWEKGCLD